MGRKKQGGPKKQGGYTSLAIGIAILIAVVAAWGVMNGFELSLTTSMPSKVKTKSAKASVTKGDTSTPVVPSTSDAKPKKAIKKDKKKENKKENRDEVMMTEYFFVGINHTVQMKQNWWHATEAAAGEKALGQPAPTWEAQFVAAEYLTRHRDPWMPTAIAALRPPEPKEWDWREVLTVVLGAEIGLTTTAAALIGSAVVAFDSSIRLLEAARNNVYGNVPKEGSRVAVKKALWGAPLSLESLTQGAKKSADVIVASHASCATLLQANGMMQTALSVCGSHTLLLVAFQGASCPAVKELTSTFEVAQVPKDKVLPDLADDVTLLAMKLKPATDHEEDET